MQRFTFFIGKGGVGKTTISAAYAVSRAAKAKRRKILLLSTDPAHSLGDVLQKTLSDRPARVLPSGNLFARELDAAKRVRRFLAEERDSILELLERGSLFRRQELEALLDTSLPGMAEVAAVLALHDLVDSDYDEVVVDTAPMGHAIRLFEMPEHLTRFVTLLEVAAERDLALARQFGGRVGPEPALQRWTRVADVVRRALSRDGARLVLVTTPESFSLHEAARSAELFGANGFDEVVLNRAVKKAKACRRCAARAKQTERARRFLATHFPQAKVWVAPDNGGSVMGLPALRALSGQTFTNARTPPAPAAPASAPLNLQKAEWPAPSTPLVLTLGKGGVGKTTVSAALAFRLHTAKPRERVSVCSIDPAPSLDDIFQQKVNDDLSPVLDTTTLRAAELDASAQYRRWSAELKDKLHDRTTVQAGGMHVDWNLDRRFLTALLDVVPPGVDELFATFRILDWMEVGDRVLIDMAPTGHALEVLRTPERMLAWTRVLLKTLATHRTLTFAREAAVELAGISQQARRLAAMLRDRRQCAVVVVTLPEVLVRAETSRLLQALSQLRAQPGLIIVNRVLMNSSRCARCNRQREWQYSSLARLRTALQTSKTVIYCQREFDREIAGKKGLQQFTGELWRLM